MEIDEIKKLLQSHLSDGLVVIVGSGLSSAEGIPGMTDLGDRIINIAEQYTDIYNHPNWADIAYSINNEGLEAAFLNHKLNPDAETSIMNITADYLLEYEQKIIEEVISGHRILRFSRLLKHLLKPTKGIQIVSTNYDRLIEIACEYAGLGVNNLFLGHYFGDLNTKESRFSQCRGVKTRFKRAELTYRDHACVYKPHGSFDWYQLEDRPIRYFGYLNLPRLIITPGINKFRNGYESPFDIHREHANREINKASRFLIIGYGFNDDHLETHLKTAISSGKPTLLMTHSISEKARELIQNSPSFFALEHSNKSDGTHFCSKDLSIDLEESKMWDLNEFINEVLEP